MRRGCAARAERLALTQALPIHRIIIDGCGALRSAAFIVKRLAPE
jgi:hypothetical protein